LSSAEQYEVGIVCGQCESFNPVDASDCIVCQSDLSLRQTVGQDTLETGTPASFTGQPPHSDLDAIAPPEASKSPTTTKGQQAPASEEKLMEPARHYVCRSCSSAVPAGHKFCGRCGTPVPQSIREMKTNFFGDMQNPNKAKLILIRGEGMDGLSFHLKAEQHIVGREGQLIFPDDPFVSPKHANFFYRNGKLVVRDEGSLNGVYIRIREPVALTPGGTFLVGEQLLRFDEVEPVSDDGPEPDGTAFYASPKRESAFRLTQIFRGGAVGMAVQAMSNTMVVGRDGADLNFPEDLFLSGEHCKVEQQQDGFVLTDLDSRNGTYVQIDDERDLDQGDYVFIGRKLLRVEMNTN
jgi:pSer/pThr/pTyr-binding forkhead associated (FHA) protein/ribosomal protein L40E